MSTMTGGHMHICSGQAFWQNTVGQTDATERPVARSAMPSDTVQREQKTVDLQHGFLW